MSDDAAQPTVTTAIVEEIAPRAVITRPSIWQTKEGQRARKIAAVVKWPLVGGLAAVGALVVVKIFGPATARTLGRTGGEAFAEGVAKVQNQLTAARGRGERWG